MFGFLKSLEDRFVGAAVKGDRRPSAGGGRGRPSKILIHGINFHPECIGVGKYSGELAFSLARKGHRVEVVTAPPHYPDWEVKPPFKAWAFRREKIAGVSVLRCPILTKRGGQGIWRAIAPSSFALFAAPAVIWRILRTRPDVVMCVEPTLFSAPAALLGGKLVGARTVLHVQDLEVDAAFEVGHLRGAKIRKVAHLLERMILRRFDLLVTISQKMREALVRKGVRPQRTAVLRNWVDLDAICPLPGDAPNPFRRDLGLANDSFVILYSGHLGRKQALDVLLEAASLCVDHPHLHFVIVGEGPMKAELIARHGDATNVTFLPLQPVERFNDLLNLANLHVLPQRSCAGDLVLPSKLGGMLASGRPVIATVEPDTELARMLEGVALSVPTGQPAALAGAIIAAWSQDLSLLIQRGLRLAAHLSNKHILANFEALLIGAAPTDTANASDAIFDPLIAG